MKDRHFYMKYIKHKLLLLKFNKDIFKKHHRHILSIMVALTNLEKQEQKRTKDTLLELDELRHIVIVKRRINYFKYFLFFLLIIILFPQTQKRVYKTIKFW
jgi:hypothetical protein